MPLYSAFNMDADIVNLHIVTPGEIITKDPSFIRGHGTYQTASGELVASVAGVVERVNKLVTVKPLKSRYVVTIASNDGVALLVRSVMLLLAGLWRYYKRNGG